MVSKLHLVFCVLSSAVAMRFPKSTGRGLGMMADRRGESSATVYMFYDSLFSRFGKAALRVP